MLSGCNFECGSCCQRGANVRVFRLGSRSLEGFTGGFNFFGVGGLSVSMRRVILGVSCSGESDFVG